MMAVGCRCPSGRNFASLTHSAGLYRMSQSAQSIWRQKLRILQIIVGKGRFHIIDRYDGAGT